MPLGGFFRVADQPEISAALCASQQKAFPRTRARLPSVALFFNINNELNARYWDFFGVFAKILS
jgi:hypothetical protein